MRSRRPSQEHQEAVSRRLALLSAELAGLRPGQEPADQTDQTDRYDRADRSDPDQLVHLERPAADGSVWWSGHTRLPEQRPHLEVVPDPAPSWMPDPAPAWTPDPVPAAVPAPVPVVPAAMPARVPVPGRHAARRARTLALDSWPDTLRGRVALAPAQLTWVAIAVALALAVAAWWVVHRDASPGVPLAASSAAPLVAAPSEALPAVSAAGAPTDVGETATPSATAPAASVTVDVEGKVRRPGIAVLAAGDRVVDALKSAGGALPHADLSGLNLARVLVDGEQLVVGSPVVAATAGAVGSTAPAPPAGVTGATTAPTALVDLNTATEEQLDALPEVGPVTAAAIIDWREENGGFTSVQDLLEVNGIGQVTLDRLTPLVTI